MGAATWTRTAKDITEEGPAEWARYLTVQQLSDAIGLAVATIMDTLPRTPRDLDPRHAIYRPAARIGQTAVAAVPLWTPEQRDEYLRLDGLRTASTAKARRSKTTAGPDALPVVDVADAAERGLASTEELAGITGYAENTLRRFARENGDFPPEVAIAARVAPNHMGPPRTLREIAAVQRWIAAKEASGRGPVDLDTADEGERDAAVPAA